jgi:hypothetical protein
LPLGHISNKPLDSVFVDQDQAFIMSKLP